MNPMTGIDCCARAASGHAAAPPSATSNSRRPMVTVIRPSRASCVKERIPRHERAVLTAWPPARAGRHHEVPTGVPTACQPVPTAMVSTVPTPIYGVGTTQCAHPVSWHAVGTLWLLDGKVKALPRLLAMRLVVDFAGLEQAPHGGGEASRYRMLPPLAFFPEHSGGAGPRARRGRGGCRRKLKDGAE